MFKNVKGESKICTCTLSCTADMPVERFALAETAGANIPVLAEVKRVRSLFPETWIWLEYNARYTVSCNDSQCIASEQAVHLR